MTNIEQVTIRVADVMDEPEIWRLCAAMHAEQPYHPLSWNRVVPQIRLATQHERGIVGVIGERGKTLRGAVFLVLDQVWYSDEWYLIEKFNFVDEQHRKSNYGKELIKYSKSCADALGVDLTMGVFSSKRTEAKVKLYKRMPGFEYMGGFFNYTPERVKLMRAQPANAVAAE